MLDFLQTMGEGGVIALVVMTITFVTVFTAVI